MIEKDFSVLICGNADAAENENLLMLSRDQIIRDFFFGDDKYVPGSPSKKIAEPEPQKPFSSAAPPANATGAHFPVIRVMRLPQKKESSPPSDNAPLVETSEAIIKTHEEHAAALEQTLLMERKRNEEALAARLAHKRDASDEPIQVEDHVSAKRAERLQRIEAIDKIEKSMLHEIEFEQNQAVVTSSSMETINAVAAVLKDYPELMIHIESHTNCSQTEAFNCNRSCRMADLSQRRVDLVRSLFEERGCRNVFVTKGWGCKHPKIGRTRLVRIFPEDLEHEVDV
jgi:outer membrane protein OmpA-like peptidoglycan-associated protein